MDWRSRNRSDGTLQSNGVGYRWLDDRIAIRDVFDDVGSKYVPPHVNIFYCFGGLVFTSFIAQVTTGAAMTFYYVPEVSRSLSSVAYITYEARNGWALS